MRFLGLMLLGALGLEGCAKSPPVLDANDLTQVASDYVAIFNDLDNWDDSRIGALFGRPAKLDQHEHMKWMHAQVGDCGNMRLIWSRGLKRGRFGFDCERGGLEVSLRLDGNGQIFNVISGLTGVAPTPAVSRALDEVLAAMPYRKSVAGQQPWGHAIKSAWTRSRGACEVERVRTVSETIGVFDLRCEKGGMYIWVDVKKDGQIGQVRVWRPEQDEARAYRRQPVG